MCTTVLNFTASYRESYELFFIKVNTTLYHFFICEN